MRLLLRCDGSPSIGVGHVVRSLAIAGAAVARGHEVAVLGRIEGDLLLGLVDDLGPGVSLLGPSGSDEPGALAEVAAGYDVLHVDHYDVPDGLLAAVRGEGRQERPVLSVMTDGAFGGQAADLLVDPTIHAECSAPPADARWHLRGARYVALRTSVTALRGTSRSAGTGEPAGSDHPGPSEDALASARGPKVIVVFGGTDPRRCAPWVVDALASTGVPVRVTVVSTPATHDDLMARAEAWGDRLVVTPPVADLPVAMAAADLVVTAAGTSVWELCAMARAMAVVAVVDNQVDGYQAVVAAGAAVGLGSPTDLRDTAATAELLRPALTRPGLRDELSAAAGRIVDDLGAWRVVASFEEVLAGAGRREVREVPGLAIRPAQTSDAHELWLWRNDEQTRANSRSREPVPFESHLAWLESSLDRPDRHLLVAEVEGRAVGTVRWDREAPGEWEVSITVAPHARGTGLGAVLLASAQDWLVGAEGGPVARALPATPHQPGSPAAHAPGVTTFLATVHASNVASRRLFLGAGYLPDRPEDELGFERFSACVR